MLVTSLTNLKIKEIAKLKDKKYRDTTKLFLVEGKQAVLEAYNQQLLKKVIMVGSSKLPFAVDTVNVTKEVMKKLSSLDNPSSIMGIVAKREEQEIGNKVLILDGVQDPGNLGTIIRSAVAFNFDTIVLSPKCVDLYNEKVLRATQGMLLNINIIRRDLKSVLEYLHEECYVIVGTNVQKGDDVRKMKKYSHYALIMGSEGQGMSEEISNLCDEFIYIKMNQACESLNVAVATSIILYELAYE